MNTKSTIKKLSAPGLRVTNQRALILEIIRRGRGHMDADEIHKRAREKNPRISLSTVYRTLQTLKKLELVEELHFNEEHHHYEIKSSAEHHHLICAGCGKVVEFECPFSEEMKETVSREKNFEVTEVEVQMKGYCPRCRQKRK